MPFLELQQELEARAAQGLLRRRRTLDSPQSPHIVVDGGACLSFCSNDYLGLANHPRLIAALQQGAQQWGVGAGAAHLVSGHFEPHHRLEQELAAFVGKPAALLFSTGYMANFGAVQALAGKGDTVFADRLNHASLNDAMLLSRAAVKRYRHNDIAQLAALLEQTQAGRKLVITAAPYGPEWELDDFREDLPLTMDEHIQRVEELFSATKTELKHLEFYYFHNCVYDFMWKNNRRRYSEKFATWDIIRKYNKDYKLIFVGDATMSPYEILQPGGSVEYNNEEAGVEWLQRLTSAFPKFAWINPEPQGVWQYRQSISVIQQVMSQRMFPLTIKGLEEAMRLLTK